MSEKPKTRTIIFTPTLLSANGGSSTSARKIKPVKPTAMKPLIRTEVKQQFLNKIKQFQQKTSSPEKLGSKKKQQMVAPVVTDPLELEFNDEFNKSLHFLQTLAVKNKNNTTLKRSALQIATELPPELQRPTAEKRIMQSALIVPTLYDAPQTIAAMPPTPLPQQHMPGTPQPQPQPPQLQPQPPPQQTLVIPQSQQAPFTPQNPLPVTLAAAPAYSNLKNGSKPTYRTWTRSTQKAPIHKVAPPTLTDREIALAQFKKQYQDKNKSALTAAAAAAVQEVKVDRPSANLLSTPVVPKQRRRQRITRTMKFKLGKRGGKVSVLIKNADTRKLVQEERQLLKYKSITDIKTYLRSKNLLKVGSQIPNDVLRQLYEAAILAGDVTNKSKETLIHNYFTTGSS